MTGANVDPVSRPDHETLLAHLYMSVATRTTVTLTWRGCERAPSNLTKSGEAAPRGRPYCVVSRAGARFAHVNVIAAAAVLMLSVRGRAQTPRFLHDGPQWSWEYP
jgi:hypothetical protein